MLHLSLANTHLPVRADAPVVLQLLGTPEIRHRGEPKLLPRTQTRALMFRLGARLEPLSRAELATMFWPETSDSIARQNLRRLLSFARSDLPEPNAMVTNSESVALNPELVWSDAHQLDRLAQADNVGGWEATVQLYSGTFLTGFFLRHNAEFELWQSSTAERLRTHCLNALAKLVEYHAAAGEVQRAIHYGRRYLEIDNVAETIHRELITLYTRLGQRGLALRQYEECAVILERELGVDPLPETRAAYKLAHQHCSAQVLAAPAAPVTWSVLPGLDVPLIGREDAWRQLATAYQRSHHGGFVFLTGESGIGKSRLLRDFVVQQNALVLTGRCHAGSEMLPYYPLIEVLRQAIRTPYFGQGVAGDWLAEVAELLPDVRAQFSELMPHPQVARKATPVRLYEALVQILLGLAARRQVILCLEDLHWVDKATANWLQHALTRLRAGRVCVVATSVDLTSEALRPMAHALARHGLLSEVKLDGLDVPAVLAILRAARPAAPEDVGIANDIHSVTAGNPFFVLELVRELLLGRSHQSTSVQWLVPETVQLMIMRRVELLSPTARQVLEAAAVLNPVLEFDVLHATTGRSQQEVADGLEELVAQQLLCQAGQGMRFRHSIVRMAIYAQLRSWRRQLLHKRAAEALQWLGNGYAQQMAP